MKVREMVYINYIEVYLISVWLYLYQFIIFSNVFDIFSFH